VDGLNKIATTIDTHLQTERSTAFYTSSAAHHSSQLGMVQKIRELTSRRAAAITQDDFNRYDDMILLAQAMLGRAVMAASAGASFGATSQPNEALSHSTPSADQLPVAALLGRRSRVSRPTSPHSSPRAPPDHRVLLCRHLGTVTGHCLR
jgi:hypothetical protein